MFTLEMNAEEFTRKLDSLCKDREVGSRLTRYTSGVARGTYKAWCQSHDGVRVDTIQVQIRNSDENVLAIFAPMNRTIDARGTYALFDESRDDYAGTRVLMAGDRGIVTKSVGEYMTTYRAVFLSK